jgi:menaquinone-9 beta-reductase
VRSLDAEVAIVGGGPSGAIAATLPARRGRHVVVLERAPAWRWRACGVFTSPVTVAALRAVDLAASVLSAAARPIPAMRVETSGGASFRLTYRDAGARVEPAVGFDRRVLDEALLDGAIEAGADVRSGWGVRSVRLADPPQLDIESASGQRTLTARIVLGADGARSVVARGAGVQRLVPFADRIGLTFHVPDHEPGQHDARMVVLPDAYVGLAPVPTDRINVGIVLSGRRRADVRQRGAAAVAREVLGRVGVAFEPLDAIAGAAPLAHGVRARAGSGWLLIGDAAGFLDPFTGEGLHRAIVSARLGADAADAHLRGDPNALRRYHHAMQARFRTKDLVTLIVQAFLQRPAAFEYAARRLEARSGVRETMGLVMGDLVPASNALDPRFLAALLRP